MERKCSDGKDTHKPTSPAVRERWLLTRKTWRYMSDAGKKLFPEGVDPNKPEDISKVEEHFQDLSRRCNEYIRHHPEKGIHSPPESPFESETRFDFLDVDDDECLEGAVSLRRDSSASDTYGGIPQEMFNALLQCYGPSVLHEVASKLLEEQLIEEHELSYDEEDGEIIQVQGRLMRSVGVQTDPYLDMCVQTDEDISAEDFVKVGAETKAETQAAVAQERALLKQKPNKPISRDTEKQWKHPVDETMASEMRGGYHSYDRPTSEYDFQEPESRSPNIFRKNAQAGVDPYYSADNHEEHLLPASTKFSTPSQASQVSYSSGQAHQTLISQPGHPPSFGHQSHPQVPSQPPPPPPEQHHVKQPPVLKRFWARRESLTKGESLLNQIGSTEKQLSAPSDKDKGVVAEKLASLEAVYNTAQGAPVTTRPESAESPVPTKAMGSNSNLSYGGKPQAPSSDKKRQLNVFKLGLKCDIDAQPAPHRKESDKTKVDRFKTVNYDKTLSSIKSKWVPSKEEESFIQSILSRTVKEHEHEMRCIEKKGKAKGETQTPESIPKATEKEKQEKMKKRKTRAIQVGEPLPQFILSSFRINSPVEVIHATKRRLRRLSSKAESISGSESSVPPSGMLSPRYSITLLEEQGTRQLKVSENEAYKLSQMGIPFTCNPSSSDSLQGQEDPELHEPTRRSISAIQVSGHIAQILHSIKGSRLFHSSSGSHSADKSRNFTKSILQSFLPAVMQRGRQPSSGQTSRLAKGKKLWRTRSKSQSRLSAGTTSIWTPHGKNTWMSVTGRTVTLEATTLMHLTELERITLQSVAMKKLKPQNLGCTIKIPKEPPDGGGKKTRHLLLKRKAASANIFDGKKEDGHNSGFIFGISLSKCIENDRHASQEAELQKTCTHSNSGEEFDLDSACHSRKSSHASCFSLLESSKQTDTGSLESLNLERKRPSLGNVDFGRTSSPASPDLLVVQPQLLVPRLITICCKHVEKYGLHTVGIFRVSPSKKRVRQLREEFDAGKDISLTEEHCPHDVAALIKEFLRDLPEPLLTKDLYEAFLSSQKIRDRKLQLQTLQRLTQLLPPPNRDTLHVLLNFLTIVSENSEDITSVTGEVKSGNKMNSSNLATVFAPNILHQAKQGAQAYSAAEMKISVEERGDVINVIRCMIDHHKDLFEVNSELLDETYRMLMDSHPESLDVLLRRRCTGNDEFDFEMETGSSVFEESDISSPLPRSPTDHLEFERLSSQYHGDDSPHTGVGDPHDRLEKPNLRRNRPVGMDTQHSQRDKKSSVEGEKEEKVLPRRRRRNDSTDLPDEHSEKSMWFKKRDKRCPSPQEEKLTGESSEGKTLQSKLIEKRGRLSSHDSIDSQGAIKIVSTNHNKNIGTKNKLGPRVRRLSSSEVDGSVITASLKIQVPYPQHSLSFNQENIPYIEDSPHKDSSSSRKRTGSNDSFLGQPITGSMSFHPLYQKDQHKSSHDSMVSSSSMGFYTMTPSERNTPNSDAQFMSGASTPSEAFSPPSTCLSPDSGTPGLSPPSTPPPPQRRRRKDDPMTESSQLVGIKPLPPVRSRSKGHIASMTSLSRSATSDSITILDSPSNKENDKTLIKVESNTRPYTRRRYAGEKRHTDHIPKVDSSKCHPRQVDGHKSWKSWEIKSTDPSEPETFV